MREERLHRGRLIQQGVGESDESYQERLRAAVKGADKMREGIHGEDPETGEEIRLDEPKPAASTDPGKVLEELQAQIAERNLPEAEVERLVKEPEAFLAGRLGGSRLDAQTIVATVAGLYFLTLHKRAVEGEAFTEARVKQALIEARTRTLEALATYVQSSGPDYALKVAELVSKD